jgi:hypothetical protein
MVEDYRAGLGIDRADDDADQAAGRRVSCPLLRPGSPLRWRAAGKRRN